MSDRESSEGCGNCGLAIRADDPHPDGYYCGRCCSCHISFPPLPEV